MEIRIAHEGDRLEPRVDSSRSLMGDAQVAPTTRIHLILESV